MDWKNKLYNIQNKVKFQLHAKKIDDLESLYKLIDVSHLFLKNEDKNYYKQCDLDHSGYLDKDEFLKFLSRLGVFLSTQVFLKKKKLKHLLILRSLDVFMMHMTQIKMEKFVIQSLFS